MPTLNHNGEYLAGIGGGVGNLHISLGSDNRGTVQPIGFSLRPVLGALLGVGDTGEGSGWFWFDQDTIAGQYCGDPTNYDQKFGITTGCSIWTYNLHTQKFSGPIGPGANNGSGNQRGLAGFWLGTGGYGAYTTQGYRSALGAFAGAFANGDCLILKTYQQDVLGFWIVRGTSQIGEIKTIGQVGGIKVRGNVALWYDLGAGQMKAYGAPDPVSVPAYNGTNNFAADSTGRLWISNGQEGLLMRCWDQPIGYWLSHDAFNFTPDVVTMPDGRLRVVSAENIGEGGQCIRVWDFDPLTGAYTFGRAGASLESGHADLIDLNTGGPTTLPAPPANPISTRNAVGPSGSADLFPIIVGAGMLGAYYLIHRGD